MVPGGICRCPFPKLTLGAGSTEGQVVMHPRGHLAMQHFWRRRTTCMDAWVHARGPHGSPRPFLLAEIDSWGLITLEMFAEDTQMTWGPDSRWATSLGMRLLSWSHCGPWSSLKLQVIFKTKSNRISCFIFLLWVISKQESWSGIINFCRCYWY